MHTRTFQQHGEKSVCVYDIKARMHRVEGEEVGVFVWYRLPVSFKEQCEKYPIGIALSESGKSFPFIFATVPAAKRFLSLLGGSSTNTDWVRMGDPEVEKTPEEIAAARMEFEEIVDMDSAYFVANMAVPAMYNREVKAGYGRMTDLHHLGTLHT